MKYKPDGNAVSFGMRLILWGMFASAFFAFSPRAVPAWGTSAGQTGKEAEKSCTVLALAHSSSPFDSVSSEELRMSHVFSLDNFLEGHPFYVISRMGPIGADATLSRYGMGEGRCGVYMEGVLLNDPQTGIAPFVFIPTTFVDGLFMGPGQGDYKYAKGIEGDMEILSPGIPEKKPSTFIEVSKGWKELKQRRVRFSSIRSRLGLDMGYDELLNGGYQFNSRKTTKVPGFGSSSLKIYSFRLRGDLKEGDGYAFTFRNFAGAFQGDINDPSQEKRRSGHIALLRASLRNMRILIFSRGYEFLSPDSATSNQTLGLRSSYNLQLSPRTKARVWGEANSIVAKEEVMGKVARPRLKTFSAGSEITYNKGGFKALMDVFMGYQLSHARDFGGELRLEHKISSQHQALISLRRNFRLPNLGELFLPDHYGSNGDSLMMTGDENLRSESDWEASVALFSRVGPLLNELKLTSLRVSDMISFRRKLDQGVGILAPRNGGGGRLDVLEDRLRFSKNMKGFEVAAIAGIAVSKNNGRSFVASVPSNRVQARLSIGKEVFKPSTSATLTLEYGHSNSRKAAAYQIASGYDVMNFKLELTLFDARFFLMFYNAFNKHYQTLEPYLMTPRTFVYGIEWTMFE